MYHRGVLYASDTTDCYVLVQRRKNLPFAEIFSAVRNTSQKSEVWRCRRFWNIFMGLRYLYARLAVDILENHTCAYRYDAKIYEFHIFSGPQKLRFYCYAHLCENAE